MELKSTYTDSEIDEITSWFSAHAAQLPARFSLDKATTYPDFKRTVSDLCMLARVQHANPAFGAQIGSLFRLRDKLLEDGALAG